MTNRDLTTFNADSVQKTPEQINAVVTNVTFKSAKDVYGANLPSNLPEDDTMLSIEYESAAFEVNGTLNFKFYDAPVPENSKMGKFLQKYNQLIPQTVLQLKKNEDGFFKVVM